MHCLQGAALQQSAQLGCAAGAQAVQVEGAELSAEAWALLRGKATGILQSSQAVKMC
jgi:sugar/nucleoside kinase (ribokinase family)